MQNILLLVVLKPSLHSLFIAVAMFLGRIAYAVRPSLCVGIPTQINSLTQGHCEGRPSLGLGTRMTLLYSMGNGVLLETSLRTGSLIELEPAGLVNKNTSVPITIYSVVNQM